MAQNKVYKERDNRGTMEKLSDTFYDLHYGKAKMQLAPVQGVLDAHNGNGHVVEDIVAGQMQYSAYSSFMGVDKKTIDESNQKCLKNVTRIIERKNEDIDKALNGNGVLFF